MERYNMNQNIAKNSPVFPAFVKWFAAIFAASMLLSVSAAAAHPVVQTEPGNYYVASTDGSFEIAAANPTDTLPGSSYARITYDRINEQRRKGEAFAVPAVLYTVDDGRGGKQQLDWLTYHDLLYGPGLPENPPLDILSDGTSGHVGVSVQSATHLAEQNGWPWWKTALVVGGTAVVVGAVVWLAVELGNNDGSSSHSTSRSDNSKDMNITIPGDNNTVTITSGSGGSSWGQ
jgi:hypothetical protein